MTSATPRSRAVAKDRMAYVIYTSGSTGRPKGVAITHEAIAHQLSWLERAAHLDGDSVILQKTPISFDAAQWEILGCASGARVVFTGHGTHRQPGELLKALSAERVTTLQCVPTLWSALLDEAGFSESTTLARIFSGGEALSASLAARLRAALPSAELINLYGPTECTINATSHRVTDADLAGGPQTVPIGRPIDGVRIRIVDESLADVSEGTQRELLLGGPQIARGYLNDPAKTADRFIVDPHGARYYRTGDIVHRDPQGVLHFHGREDGQVKVNGHRVELEEISTRVEGHPWVKRATVALVPDARTGHDRLVVCAELDPIEASLMDQEVAGAHHRSKSSRVQVRAQLANGGIRKLDSVDDDDLLALPRPANASAIRRAVFGRKTYRNFHGGATSMESLAALLSHRVERAADPAHFGLAELSEILRWFGQFHSDERLLPKYAYASPGALYGVQLYVAISSMPDVADGVYYYDPTSHRIARIAQVPHSDGGSALEFHFRGLPRVIRSVYEQNVHEVLDLETGHMVGVLDLALADYGFGVVPIPDPDCNTWKSLLTAGDVDNDGDDPLYLGGVRMTRNTEERFPELVRVFVQVHNDRVTGLRPGLYEWTGADFDAVSTDIIESRHVIAINQEAYEASSFGIALAAEHAGKLSYIALGRALHHLQANPFGFGLMSSGYSSRSGNSLAAALRMEQLVKGRNISMEACYFAVGGRVSAEQVASESMDEDAVHMSGPAEIIRKQLARTLPSYMLPHKVLLVERLPHSPNGKVDRTQVTRLLDADEVSRGSRFVAPRTATQRWLAAQWSELLGIERISATDDFFAVGGTSLIAMRLTARVRVELGRPLPVQEIFNRPRLNLLAQRIDQLDQSGSERATPSRIIRLHDAGPQTNRPIFAWPGLGGSPTGLRTLASRITGRDVYGIQALGINEDETPASSLVEMAKTDINEIRRVQTEGPYTLVGYSFGARVAFETAWQLERAGETVDVLLMICPGNPSIEATDESAAVDGQRMASWNDERYLRILGSVFTGTINGDRAKRICAEVHDLNSFLDYVVGTTGAIDEATVRRIVRVVETTYSFDYTIKDLAERHLTIPIRIVRARGDDYSFIDGVAGLGASEFHSDTVSADHYSILREDVGELVELIDSHRLLEPKEFVAAEMGGTG